MPFRNARGRIGKIFAGFGLAAAVLTGSVMSVYADGAAETSGTDKQSITQDAGNLTLKNIQYTPSGTAPSAGLSLGKAVTANDDGTLTVTLEAYVTGKDTVSYQPVDAVVVMDCSGSMAVENYGEEKKRIEVMKTAVTGFIDRTKEVNEAMPDDEKSRVALVQFSDSDLTNVVSEFTVVNAPTADTLKNKVNALEAKVGQHTRTDKGMSTAWELIKGDGESGRKKVVVLLTDGQPNDSDGFQPSFAEGALSSAKSIKEAGAEVYVISMYPYCDPLAGAPFPQYTKDARDNSSTNPDWESFIYILQGKNLNKETANAAEVDDAAMAAITNRFFHLISSNNPHAASMDVPNAEDTQDTGKMAVNGKSFFTRPDTPEEMRAVFDNIITKTGEADVNIGAGAVLRDVVTEDFVLVENSAAAFTAKAKKKTSEESVQEWEEPTQDASITVTADASKGIVEAAGFDYAANYVSGSAHADSREGAEFYGKKMILSFRIKPVKTFGGNGIPTNTGASGVYKDGSDKTPLGCFDIPEVDIEIAYEIDGEDKILYVPEKVNPSSLSSFVQGYVPDGTNNRHVDIHYIIRDSSGETVAALDIPAGAKSGDCAWKTIKEVPDTCGVYTIRCKIAPVKEGAVETLLREKDVTVHVFHPCLVLKDTEVKQKERADVTIGALTDNAGLEGHFGSIAWKCTDGTTAEGSVPGTGYFVHAISGIGTDGGKNVLEASDMALLSLQVFRLQDDKMAGADITEKTEFGHTCSVLSDCSFDVLNKDDPEIRFLIHTADAGKTPVTQEDTKSDTSEKKSADTTISVNRTQNTSATKSKEENRTETRTESRTDNNADTASVDTQTSPESAASVKDISSDSGSAVGDIAPKNSASVSNGSSGNDSSVKDVSSQSSHESTVVINNNIEIPSEKTAAQKTSSDTRTDTQTKTIQQTDTKPAAVGTQKTEKTTMTTTTTTTSTPAAAGVSSGTQTTAASPSAASTTKTTTSVITDRPATGERGDRDLWGIMIGAAAAIFCAGAVLFIRQVGRRNGR